MKTFFSGLLAVASFCAAAQNDQDAIRMSRAGQGGTSRALAMGGAFGAVGADVSASAFNPAGLALFRRGELSFSGGLHFLNNTGELYNAKTSVADLRLGFNNFGLATVFNSSRDPESRHALAFSSTQIQNFSGKVRMSGYTNNSSIGKEWVNIARFSQNPDYLDPAYTQMAYDAYLLDYDEYYRDSSITYNGYMSLIDTRRTVKQTRDLIRSGQMNDLNISYAFTYKDRYYIGASLGIPRVDYSSTTSHYEFDDRDSMRITFSGDGTHEDTYIDELPSLAADYASLGGFHSMEFTEYFRTRGTGYNLKLGAIARVNEHLRLGFYYHTPTVFNLTDTYASEISAYFDQAPSEPMKAYYPEENSTGRFSYKIFTPSRLAINTAFLFGKKGLISVDYEYINYRRARLESTDIGTFADVNDIISADYGGGHNIKAGGELNLDPVMLRAGYVMLGSPFGEVFTGKQVRNTVSAGLGFRFKSNFYLDLLWMTTVNKEDYFLFSTLDTRAGLSFSDTMFGATLGLKF